MPGYDSDHDNAYFSASGSWPHVTGQRTPSAPSLHHELSNMPLGDLEKPTTNDLSIHIALRSDGLLLKSATTRQVHSVLAQPLERKKTMKERRLEKVYSESQRWVKVSEGKVGRKVSRKSKKVVRLYPENGITSPPSSIGQSRQHSRKLSQESSSNSRKLSKVREQLRGFADNDRVRKLYESRPLPAVPTDARYKGDSSAPTAGDSIQPTPVEMYEAQSSVQPHVIDEVQTPIQSPLIPIGGDHGSMAVLAATSNADGPIERISNDVRLKIGSVAAVTPELTAWQRSAYLPGPIRLESSLIPPSTSVLTDIDHFHQQRGPGYISHTRNASDDAILDEVVDFFFSFGLADFQPDYSPSSPKSTRSPLVSSAAGSFMMEPLERRRSSTSLAWSAVRSEQNFANAGTPRSDFLPPVAPPSRSFSGNTTPACSGLPPSPSGRSSTRSPSLPSPSPGRSSRKRGRTREASPKISLRRMLASASSIV